MVFQEMQHSLSQKVSKAKKVGTRNLYEVVKILNGKSKNGDFHTFKISEDC